MSITGGRPKTAEGGGLGGAEVEAWGTVVVWGLVCRGGGSFVLILYRKLVLFAHCASISV